MEKYVTYITHMICTCSHDIRYFIQEESYVPATSLESHNDLVHGLVAYLYQNSTIINID